MNEVDKLMTRRLLNISFVFLVSIAISVCTTTAQAGCVSGDCQNGVGCYNILGRENKIIQSYCGDWRAGKREGRGKEIAYDADGARSIQYEGEFKNQLYSGQGIETHFAGNHMSSEVRGEWKDGQLHGQAIRIEYFENGGKFTERRGTWSNGEFRGHGELTVYRGSHVHHKIVGNWKNIREVTGKLIQFDDAGRLAWEYEGDIVDDLPHGRGKKIFPDGRTEQGRWDKDRLVGP